TLEVLSKAIHQHLSVPESGSLEFSCPTTIPILELYENFIKVRTAEARSLPFTIVLDTFHPAALPVSAVRIFRSFQNSQFNVSPRWSFLPVTKWRSSNERARASL